MLVNAASMPKKASSAKKTNYIQKQPAAQSMEALGFIVSSGGKRAKKDNLGKDSLEIPLTEFNLDNVTTSHGNAQFGTISPAMADEGQTENLANGPSVQRCYMSTYTKMKDL